MFEKVNPKHPDKIADRIAGAIVDLGYKKEMEPKIACEVLIGHGNCHIIIETSVNYNFDEIDKIVKRISEDSNVKLDLKIVKQDVHLAENQNGEIKCGDNGIFKGSIETWEQVLLTKIAKKLYERFNADGKYVLANDELIICQSFAKEKEIIDVLKNVDGLNIDKLKKITINPLGEWTGGIDVDTGATNRKLGSDMGDSVTGGGLWGKDCSKADVTVNIYANLMAKKQQKEVEYFCAIGDSSISNIEYRQMVDTVKKYIFDNGGFEKMAEWGIIV